MMHSKHFLHRDIKPSNFLIGTQKKEHMLFIIDMGLARKYMKKSEESKFSLEHVEFDQDHSFVGTARFASANVHMGYQQSRRDDMESIGYCMVYMLKGRLPWQGMQTATKKQKYD